MLESNFDETIIFLVIIVATIFPQLTKKVWKIAIKSGKIKPPIPIIPDPKLTQEASTATAKPKIRASFASIKLEQSASKFVVVLF